MEEITKAKWHFPPTKNRKGQTRNKYDVKTVILLHTNLFSEPTIITADLHSHTHGVFSLLDKCVNLEKFTVICAGDMAGSQIFGCDGDPTAHYEYMLSKCGELYFSQGNHDLPSDDGKHREKKLHNKDAKFGTQCLCALNEHIAKTKLGTIGGIDGTISNKNHEYKMISDVYCEKLVKMLRKKPHILVTHDTPSIPVKNIYGDNYVGNQEIYNIVSKYKPKIHIYGHCHHPTYHNFIDGTNYLCADGRILIMIPQSLDHNIFLKNEIKDEYIEYIQN